MSMGSKEPLQTLSRKLVVKLLGRDILVAHQVQKMCHKVLCLENYDLLHTLLNNHPLLLNKYLRKKRKKLKVRMKRNHPTQLNSNLNNQAIMTNLIIPVNKLKQLSPP